MKRFLFSLVVLSLLLFPARLTAEAVFRISTSYNNLLSNPEQTGMLDRLMIEVFRRLDIPMEIVFIPTERSLVDVNAGLLDGEINRIEGMEANYTNLVRVPEPNMTMHFVAFSRRDYRIAGWDSIRDRYIGLVSGWKILESNTDGFPHVVRTPTEIELFTMLAKDRLDIALYSKLTGYATVRALGYDDIRHLEPPLASRHMYLYVHAKHADLVGSIAAALRAMKADGTYDSIVDEVTAPFVDR
jgi:polar amino acid transport system substrate-binding protein